MDVRALLSKEREARRLNHPHATYSTTGKLTCAICQLQLKNESVWNSHLRSPQHTARLQQFEEEQGIRNSVSKPISALEPADGNTPEPENGAPSRKRKVDRDEDEGPRRKKSATGSLGEGIQIKNHKESVIEAATPSPLSAELPSRPNSVAPSPASDLPKATAVDEDEWAAFEKDIAAATLPVSAEATISAPALSPADLAKKTAEETYAERKTRLEAEQEDEREDAVRKLEDEFDEMKGFEERVKRLKERRDALRANAISTTASAQFGGGTDSDKNGIHSGDEEEGSSDEEDDWDGFRLKV